MVQTIEATEAMVKVLESWDVDHLYGIPGGSFNSTMDALYKERGNIRYIQVRHEEVGALAAAADAKLTGKIGVCFGSAGPGATHLFQGLYDAKMDHVPVLALVGQVSSTTMNYNAFQEMNENPMFADVSIYNRVVMTPASLPHVVDEAIKHAYEQKGVAVVTIPVDFGFEMIPDTYISTAPTHRTGSLIPAESDIETAVALIAEAKRPILYIGQGVRGGLQEVQDFAEHFSMPIAAAVLAKGIVPDSYEHFLGFAARLSTKPANEALALADLIVFVGSDFPFAADFFNPEAKFIQVDIDATKFGRRHTTDAVILGDARMVLKEMTRIGSARPKDQWLEANLINRRNWFAWLASFEDRKDRPLRVEPIFKELRKIVKDDAIFISDVGDVTVDAIRFLDLNGQQPFITSGWFATMGNAIPGGIAAQLCYPERQVFTISGDGGFAMVMQDIITQVKYQLPIINVILANNAFGFIEAEQDDTKQAEFGVFLQGADFGKAAEALGADGFTITYVEQLAPAFEAALKSTRPVVIDIKIADLRPIPAEHLILDPEKYTETEINKFKEIYEVHDMPVLNEILKELKD